MTGTFSKIRKTTNNKGVATRKMSIVAGDEDERESYMDDDDTKSIRSKKSMSVYSGVGRSISKKLG